jgi:hypothetical protein
MTLTIHTDIPLALRLCPVLVNWHKYLSIYAEILDK